MGLTSCPDCEGKVSDIAPTCPHCGRPFEQNVKNPAAIVPSHDSFKNSATENVYKLIWEWILMWRNALTLIIVFSVGAAFSYVAVYSLILFIADLFGFKEEVMIVLADGEVDFRDRIVPWVVYFSATLAVIFNIWLTWWMICIKKVRFKFW